MMYAIRPYRRLHAVEYARRWALSRNPLFRNFAESGGDCTNFISQCIFSGSCIMNPTPTFGWYYRASGEYAPAWTGVIYLYNFLIANMENGPVGMEVDLGMGEPGDIIQLGRADGSYYHTVIISAIRDGEIYVCAHDNDALDRPLSSYTNDISRCIHITGVRIPISVEECCFAGVFDGTSIFPTETQTDTLSCYPISTAEEPSDSPTVPPENTDESNGILPPSDALPPPDGTGKRPVDLPPENIIRDGESTADLAPHDR